MKSIRFILLAVISLMTISLFAQDKSDSFKVFGNCGMCQKRIEKAAKIDGVSAAVWNVDTKVMTVTYDASKVTNEDIQKKIAAVGHDTDKYRADDKTYDKLPGCCLYDRKKVDKDGDHSKHHH